MKKKKIKIVTLKFLDDHIKELCKNPIFKKDYLKEKKRLKKDIKKIRKSLTK